MSKCSASRSTILPLPSSPHWAPMTTMILDMEESVGSGQWAVGSKKRPAGDKAKIGDVRVHPNIPVGIKANGISFQRSNRTTNVGLPTAHWLLPTGLGRRCAGDMFINHSRDGFFGSGADDAFFFLATFEEN